MYTFIYIYNMYTYIHTYISINLCCSKSVTLCAWRVAGAALRIPVYIRHSASCEACFRILVASVHQGFGCF